MNKIGLVVRGMSSRGAGSGGTGSTAVGAINPFNVFPMSPGAGYTPPPGYIPPGGAPPPTPVGSTVNTSKDVRVALESALSTMITIARTGKADVDKIIGKVGVSPTVGGPQVIIMNDPSGNFSRGTGTIDYSFKLGGSDKKHPIVYYLEKKKILTDIQKASVGFKLGTVYQNEVRKSISSIRTDANTIKGLTESVAIDPSDQDIKDGYISFFDIFLGDLGLLEVTMNTYTGILTDEFLTEKLQDTLKAAIRFNDIYYKVRAGCPPSSASGGGGGGGTAPPALDLAQRLVALRRGQVVPDTTAQRVAVGAAGAAALATPAALQAAQQLAAASGTAAAAATSQARNLEAEAQRTTGALAALWGRQRGGARKSHRHIRKGRAKTRRHSSH